MFFQSPFTRYVQSPKVYVINVTKYILCNINIYNYDLEEKPRCILLENNYIQLTINKINIALFSANQIIRYL